MRLQTGPTPRPGYTLIELLVVVALIATLMGLLLAGIQRVRGAGQRTVAASEINQLDTAASSFKNKYGLYPPSQVGFELSGVPGLRGFMFPHRTDMPEYQIFVRMYPRWLPNSTDLPMMADGVTIDLNSSPNSLQAKGRTDYVALVQLTNTIVNPAAKPLDPNQTMVLFLGGPGALFDPNGPMTYQTGWDTVGPFAPQANNKNGPYYEFNTSRQYDANGTWDARYRDPWGTPYAYFSALSGDNYHDARALQLTPARLLVAKFPWDTATPIMATDSYDPATDTNANLTVHPLATSVQGTVVKWMNPGRIQVISAGRDLKFGPGTFQHATLPPSNFVWKPGQNFYGTSEPGDDDMANFNGGTMLGTSEQ